MKRFLCVTLAILLLLACTLTGSPGASASGKKTQSRAIAIVFDNSGSMYKDGNMAWCRATYAMEVFASMLNAGDTLLIYPMHPIMVGGKEYTMENPYRVTDSSQASTIRQIYTPEPSGTPIESIDYAAQGLKDIQADLKYMIVLTDGGTFSENSKSLSKDKTKAALDARIQEYAGRGMTVMYLGIDPDACIPSTAQSKYFVKKHAKNSQDVLSMLTEMCNLIFGRDTLPESNISDHSVEFDISMNKLIVFVQGENISNLKIRNASGALVGQEVDKQQTKYATDACGSKYDPVPDTSLQGMMVTYTDCTAGKYTIEYTGTATSIEIYYEPAAELAFIFTDAAGNEVDPDTLYEGEYKVSFGMRDAKTGKLIDSPLLGNPHYQGSYFINGKEYTISHDGASGEIPISLKMDDRFNANLSVTYLGGYTNSKGPADFGWPSDGLLVLPRPAGDLEVVITGGDSSYPLMELEEGTPYTLQVFHQGILLTGDALESVELKWQPETSNVEIKKTFAGDHWKLTLHHKDPAAPQNTPCGECTVTIYAYYTAAASEQSVGQAPLTYNITNDYAPLEMELHAPETYIVISELEESPALTVRLTSAGVPLTPELFASVQLQVDTGGIQYTLIPNEQDSSFTIKLLSTDGLEEGDYTVSVKAQYTDRIGRVAKAEDSVSLTLSNMPLWLKIVICLLILLVLIIIIVLILHIKVLPKHTHVTKKDSSMIFDGEDETKSTAFTAKIEKGQMVLHSKYAGTKTGLSMDVKPGKESYLKKPQTRRSAEVKSASVRKYGNATILEASIGSIKYVLNEDTGKLERMPKSDKPFMLKHGTPIKYSGTMLNAGVPKPFTVSTKLNFKKK